MHARRASRLTLPSALVAVAALAVFLPMTGCDDEDDGNGTPTPGTSFYGTYVDTAGHDGTIELVPTSALTASRAVLGEGEGTTLSGELRIGADAPITLTGLYAAETGLLSFASEDGAYNFNGTVTDGQAVGAGFGPEGASTFTLFLGGTASSVEVYCGTATCTSPPGCTSEASFNVAVSGGDALMTVSVDGAVGTATGTATGSELDFGATGGGLEVTVDGDITGNNVTGTWTDHAKNMSGTWSGSSASCRMGGA